HQGTGGGDLAAAYLLRGVGVARDGFVHHGAERTVVADDLQPACLDHLVGFALTGQDPFDHLAGELVGERALVHQRDDPRHLGGRDGQRAQLDLLLGGPARQLVQPQLAGLGGGGALGHRGLDQVDGVGVDQVTQLGVVQPPLRLDPGTLGGGQFGQAGPQFLHPFGGGGHRHQVGVREVPVVLHLLLAAPGGAASQVFLEVAGLLHDAVPGVQDTGLAFDLRAHGPFDRTQGVDVLGLAAGTPLVGAALVDRHVHVTAHGPFLHAHVGDAQGAGQVTQLGGVGAGDQRRVLTGAGDGLGDDLQQRDPGTVVVDVGVAGPVDTAGGAAHVGGLAGVLLHVHPLDLHPVLAQPLGGVDGDVEVTVHTD